MTQPLQPNLVGLPLAPAQCVYDPAKETLVNDLAIESLRENSLQDPKVLQTFFRKYRAWIASTDLNTVKGLDEFPCVAYSNGTSESFDKFYLKHSKSRFLCFRGEYLYHRLSWEQQGLSWAYIDDTVLQPGDAVVISLPFADTGNQHPGYTEELLDHCAANNIPVLLDCAFFGVCSNITFDFSHPAITEICFSHSKAFPASTLRIGIRFSREDDHDSLAIYNNTQYINRLGAAIGAKLMTHQTPDEIYERYRNQQLSWCKEHYLEPSNTVLFGLDHTSRYANHNRGYVTHRLCFSKYFNTGPLPL